MKKLTSIWAKIQKKGLKYTKEFVLKAKDEFMKMIIKKGLDTGTDLTSNVLDKLM